jgi:hypothetical protein
MPRPPTDNVFEGGPCPRGHTLRYLKDGKCVECTRAKARGEVVEQAPKTKTPKAPTPKAAPKKPSAPASEVALPPSRPGFDPFGRRWGDWKADV